MYTDDDARIASQRRIAGLGAPLAERRLGMLSEHLPKRELVGDRQEIFDLMLGKRSPKAQEGQLTQL